MLTHRPQKFTISKGYDRSLVPHKCRVTDTGQGSKQFVLMKVLQHIIKVLHRKIRATVLLGLVLKPIKPTG